MIFFFLEVKVKYIEVPKWIIITFENLLGLKDKCEIIPLNISDD
jgi:hypothetical protein